MRASQFKVDAIFDTPQYSTLVLSNCAALDAQLRRGIGTADSMQCPDRAVSVSPPHNGYTEEMVRQAYVIAAQIVNNCEEFVNKMCD